jgi:hypothetical protein
LLYLLNLMRVCEILYLLCFVICVRIWLPWYLHTNSTFLHTFLSIYFPTYLPYPTLPYPTLPPPPPPPPPPTLPVNPCLHRSKLKLQIDILVFSSGLTLKNYYFPLKLVCLCMYFLKLQFTGILSYNHMVSLGTYALPVGFEICMSTPRRWH